MIQHSLSGRKSRHLDEHCFDMSKIAFGGSSFVWAIKFVRQTFYGITMQNMNIKSIRRSNEKVIWIGFHLSPTTTKQIQTQFFFSRCKMWPCIKLEFILPLPLKPLHCMMRIVSEVEKWDSIRVASVDFIHVASIFPFSIAFNSFRFIFIHVPELQNEEMEEEAKISLCHCFICQ